MKTIWQKDDDYYTLITLTDEAVQHAEGKLKIRLPKSYLALLKEQNGGSLNDKSFPTNVPTSWADDHIHVGYIWGIGEKHSILNSEYLISEWGLPHNIVIFSGDGHSWSAFDYRKKKENPPIIYIEADSELVIELAPDFEAFLNRLYTEEETEHDEFFYEQNQRVWTYEELKVAFLTNIEQEIIPALDYLYFNPAGNERFIEESVILLLQSPILGIKELAVTYGNGFYEKGVLSSKAVKKIVLLIRNDNEIKDYEEFYFRNPVQ
ncbi:SMI1/KNR4 family protein [Metabacillus indicus]|uniref:SMI1/KNR4 family protein n=1 Tax=Metabacillus indicus TaxID=246786 RepID=UPI0039840D87